MTIPTRQEINIYDSLDERSACKHFYGKTVDQATVMFQENSLYYQEDLMWMGPAAFRYYIKALVNYIYSESSKHDSDIINCLAGLLEFRMKHEAKEQFQPVAKILADVCDYIITNQEKFDVHIYQDVYEGLLGRFQLLRQKFIKMANP